jgi:aspartate beta-hydroxylase
MTTASEAQALLRQGRMREAEDAYNRVLERAPNDIEALNVVAMASLDRGNAKRALELLQRASSADTADASTAHHLARTYEALGDQINALVAHERAVNLRPQFNLARLYFAAALERQGATDRALLHYARAMKEAQLRGRWVDPATTPPALQPLVEHAVELIRGGRHELLFSLLKPLEEKYGRAELTRVERALRIYLNEEQPEYVDARQRPSFLLFPGLPTSAYFDRKIFSWLDAFEARTGEIREELERLLPSAAGRERVFTEDVLEAQNLRGSVGAPSWNGYYFYRHGERRSENHESCPQTSDALERLPVVRIREHAPEILFSVFTPGTHLLPHRGVTNTRVVGHLPLIVPEDCALNVGGELHVWQEGRVVVFDDTYEHEAWNRSGKTRVVLIFDLWNPYLTEVERVALADIVVAIGGLREAVDNV